MGLIGNVLNAPGAVTALGDAAKGLVEVFTPSATRQMELSAQAQAAALEQFGDEFSTGSASWFDRLVNGLNRLPRPLLAFGTIGLFVYAMVDPADFALRMVGLNAVPEPLWWLLGAVVAFYFGARETHYFRNRPVSVPAGLNAAVPATEANPALDDWRSAQN
ncbi:MAG: holin family protein [Pseudomonadota bacterium]